jgi:tripartite-type tricarboxylate transporter receptor subunit TctC
LSAPLFGHPTRPITIMVGAAAGGPTDTIARNLAPYLRESLGQPIIIENLWSAATGAHRNRSSWWGPWLRPRAN